MSIFSVLFKNPYIFDVCLIFGSKKKLYGPINKKAPFNGSFFP
nr:MAG TPA: hypothetical protein [Caudoviricetes sp.]